MGCFFPTSWMFHAPSSWRLCLLLNYPGKAAKVRVKGWDSNLCCTSSSSVLLCRVFPFSNKEVTFFPLRMGSGEAKRALHARAKPLACCDDNSQPPVTPDMSVISVVGRIFPGELRNLGLDTKVSRYGNFKSWDIRDCLKKSWKQQPSELVAQGTAVFLMWE